MQYLLYAIAFYLLLLAFPYIIAFLQFRKVILQYPKYEMQSADVVPVSVKELLQAQTKASISEETAIAMEVETFQRMEYLQQGLLSKKARTWLLLGSFGWFVASYAKIFSPETLAIFIVALLLHEGGHLLAMKLFGYRNTAILFLPFLGALATARQKHDATLTQKVWVSLAGPLPGLILGVVMAIATREGNYPDWLREAGWIFIGLNLFNLLPVYPLDGGQVADLLLFSRFPYLGVVFKVFGVLCLGLLGINSPMMLAFTLLIALSIPNSFRTAKIHIKLSKKLRKNPSIEPENLLQSIFSYLKQLGYDKLPYHQKSVLVKELMQRDSLRERYADRESRANWKTRVFLSTIYLGSLFGGVAGTFTAISPHWIDILSDSFESSQQARDPHSTPVRNRVTKTKQEEIDRATEAKYSNPNNINRPVMKIDFHPRL